MSDQAHLLQLSPPSLAVMPSYIDALREGFTLGDAGPIYGLEIDSIAHNPMRHLDYLTGPKPLTAVLPDGSIVPRTPETLLWFVEGDQFIGAACLRHTLTKNLERWGGHVDLGIRPDRRGKGYGRTLLRHLRHYAREKVPLEKLLMTCEENNLGGKRVIEANEGVVFSKSIHPYKPGERILAYWVPT